MKLKPLNEKQRELIRELEDLYRRMSEAGMVAIKHADWDNVGIGNLEGLEARTILSVGDEKK